MGVNSGKLGEIPKSGASLLVFVTKSYEDNQIEEYKMGGAWSTHGRRGKFIYFCRKTRMKNAT
jgi:hypothetical protein